MSRGSGEKLRLALSITDMGGGGAARVASVLCREWIAMGHEVHLITFERPGTPAYYDLDPAIGVHQLDASKSTNGALGFVVTNGLRVLRMRRTLRILRPDVVVAFLIEANIASILSSMGLGVPVLISERNHPAYHPRSKGRRLLRRIMYPAAARLCVQTGDISRWFQENMGVESDVIPNPVEVHNLSGDASRRSGRLRAIGLGRLEHQKGFDLMIEAFAQIADDVPEWDLVIFGEGSVRSELEAKVLRHGLQDRVQMPGATDESALELSRSDLFLHAARYEGYPNAILEALAAGLCVVATDCPGGTSEILKGGENGVLVKNSDVSALAGALRNIMHDREQRETYARRARQGVRSLSPRTIAQQWLGVVERVRSAE